MADSPRKRATYEDVINAPPHLRRQDAAWLIVATFQCDAKIRAEPFDAIELELGILSADVQL